MQNTSQFDTLARSNLNSSIGAFVAEVIARLGVEFVVTCPGSRSAPLTLGASRNSKLETLSILDERSAAFFALGHAKATRKPVVLVCTSGTACANFLPAIVEAKLSGVPLLVFTADRPYELRNCAASQVIDQTKIYGDYVNAFYEIGLPEIGTDYLGYLRQTLVHALNKSVGQERGPVHLNFSFREPLSPNATAKPVVSSQDLENSASVIVRSAELSVPEVSIDPLLLERLSSHRKGVIVVGTVEPVLEDSEFISALSVVAKQLGWPIIADILNPVRNNADAFESVVTHYDAFLKDSRLQMALKPTAILQIGPLPTSKVLRSWLKVSKAHQFLLSNGSLNIDALHGFSVPLNGSIGSLAKALPQSVVDKAWNAQWNEVEALYQKEIDHKLSKLTEAFEGQFASLLSEHAPTNTSIFIANSMSVRYAESFWKKGNSKNKIFFNRGANGIDGTLSTALGIAHKGDPVFLLCGDLAFLHDINGLLASKVMKGNLTILLMNNNGGGIFEHLPIAGQESFESYFATPQEIDFEQICAAHKVDYESIQDIAGFVPSLASLRKSPVRVLEINTDRKKDVLTFQNLKAVL